MGPTRSRSTRFLSFAFLAMLWLPDPHWPARDSTGNGLGPEAQDAAQQAETQAAVAPEIIGQLGGAAKAVAADASDPTRAAFDQPCRGLFGELGDADGLNSPVTPVDGDA